MTTKEILEQIAKDRNMTPQEVEESILTAIRAAMATDDPHAQMLWKQIAPDGKTPTVERFLNYCVDRLNRQRAMYYREEWQPRKRKMGS